MDTNKLKYFVTIAEMGSLTKASQLLRISHSGLSKAISSLESETQLKLFRPQGRGLEITHDGKWFYQKAREILKISDEISRGQKKQQTFVRIGISSIVAMTCAGILVHELNLPLLLDEVDVGDVEAKIIGNDIDFGIAFIPSPKPELEYLEIGEVIFNSFAREDLLSQLSTDSIPYVIPVNEYAANPMGYKNRDGWPADALREPRFAVSGFAIALDLLRSGQAAIYMPTFVMLLENKERPEGQKIVAVKGHEAAKTIRKLYLVKRQAMEESKDMKKAVKTIRKICCSKF